MAEQEIRLDLKARGDAAEKLGVLDKSLGGIDLKMAAIASVGAAVAGTVVKFATDGIAAYSEFDSAITELNARTQLTDEQLERVRSTAKRMGIETAFSATDAAQGMLQLVTSGSDAEEAIALIPEVLDLAAASGLDLETSADALTDVMAQFGLGAGDATEVIDTLVAASQSSSATVGDLIAAMANGGAVASTFGLSIEDTAAALAVMAESGTKGAEAGTQLKSALLNMVRDSPKAINALADIAEAADLPYIDLFDVETGEAREFGEVMKEINAGLENMSDGKAARAMAAVFGSYGVVAGAAFEAADGIDNMKEKMEGQNSASEVAEKQLESFDKQVGMLRSSMEGLMLEVFEPLVENFLKPMLPYIIDIVNGFTSWTSETGFFRDSADLLINTFTFVMAILSGDFPAALDVGKQALNSLLQVFIHVFTIPTQLAFSLVKTVLSLIEGLINGIVDGINGMLDSMPGWMKDNIYNFSGGAIDIKKGWQIGRLDLTSGLVAPEVPEIQIFQPETPSPQAPSVSPEPVDISGRNAGQSGETRNIVNVRVDIGTNVGDNDELVRMIRDAAQSGRLA